MLIHNATFTGSFSYNGVDISTITSSADTSASFATRVASLESTASVLTAASGTLDARVISLESTASILTAASASLSTTSGSLNATSASLSTASGSLNAGLVNVIARTGSFATTGSNVFYGNQTVSASMFVSGSITATGQIVAQTINVQSVTSSVVYSSGSNVFGNDVSNTQVFTGSMLITGSMRVTGTACFADTVCALSFYAVNSVSVASIFRQTDPNSYSSLRLYNDQNSAVRALEIDYFGSTHPSGERAEIFNTGAYPLLFGTSNTCRVSISSTGITSFACQVCANAFIASNGIRANNGSITSCNGTIGGSAVFIADAPDNTSDIGYRVHIGGSLKWFIGLPNNVVNDNFSIFQGGCSVDRLTISTTGNVGIGTCNPTALLHAETCSSTYTARIINTNTSSNNAGLLIKAGVNAGNEILLAQKADGTSILLIDASGNVGIGCTNPQARLDILRGSGDNVRFIGSGASDYSDIVFYATNNTTRLGYIDWSNTQSRWNVEANIPLVLYTNASERMRITNSGITFFCCSLGVGTGTLTNSSNYNILRINGSTGGEFALAGGDTDYGYMYANSGIVVLSSLANIPLRFQTNTQNRINIAGTGQVTICCQVGIGAASPIARIHTCTGYNANNLQAVFGNSNGSINCMVYDTVVIQQDDVTTLKLVERNIGSIDQVLGISVGDGFGRFSTTCTQPMQFFVNGNPSACSYNGLNGILALELASSGISTFSCGLCANRLTLAGAINLCGAIENTGTGTGVYTRSTWYADTVNQILFENGRQTDSASGTGRTVYFTWRGGPATGGGVQLQHGTNAWAAYTSDCKMKTKVADVENGLAAVMKLNPIKFKWTNELETSRTVTGFTAQNVEEAIPDAVFNSWTHCELGDIKSYYQDYLVPYLVKAIQELKCENDLFKTCLGIC